MENFTIRDTSPQLLQELICGHSDNAPDCLSSLSDFNQELRVNEYRDDEEKEKELAILFLDIRRFTGLLESLPAKEILRIIGRVFSVFNRIIKKFKGRVIEKNGDNLYAVFGLSGTLKEAANDAYHASKTMFQALDILNQNFFENAYGHTLEIGMGMHTGNVFIGEFDFETYRSTTVMGLPVNIASRLQTETKSQNNDLIISEDAYELLEIEKIHIRQNVKLRGLSTTQTIRLAGKAFSRKVSNHDLDLEESWLMAISG